MEKIKFFTPVKIFKNKLNNIDFVKFYIDEESNVFLFQFMNNSCLYYDSTNGETYKIDEYRGLSLMAFKLISNSNLVAFLYKNGDLVIIDTSYLQNENFNYYWATLSSSKKTNKDNAKISGDKKSNKSNKNYGGGGLFSEFLICGGGGSLNSMKKNFTIINVLNDIKTKDINGNSYRAVNSSIKDLTIASMIAWKKPHKNINENSHKYNDNINDSLIICFDYSLAILNISETNLSVSIEFYLQFDSMIYNSHFVSYLDSFFELQYLLIQTDENVYSLTLYEFDSNEEIINNYHKPNIVPIHPHSVFSIQQYNDENVLCCLTQLNSFDIYNLLDLNQPIIQIDLTKEKYKLNRQQIIFCSIYMKMLLVLYKDNLSNHYYISAINYWISYDSDKIIVQDECKIWCRVDYMLLNDYVLFNNKISENNIYQYFIGKNNKILLLTGNSLEEIAPMSITQLVHEVANVLKDNFNFDNLRKAEITNSSLKGSLFDYVDIIANEIPKEKGILIQLLWGTHVIDIHKIKVTDLPSSSILNFIIKNAKRNSFYNIEFLDKIIDYIIETQLTYKNLLINDNEEVIQMCNNFIFLLIKIYLVIYGNIPWDSTQSIIEPPLFMKNHDIIDTIKSTYLQGLLELKEKESVDSKTKEKISNNNKEEFEIKQENNDNQLYKNYTINIREINGNNNSINKKNAKINQNTSKVLSQICSVNNENYDEFSVQLSSNMQNYEHKILLESCILYSLFNFNNNIQTYSHKQINHFIISFIQKQIHPEEQPFLLFQAIVFIILLDKNFSLSILFIEETLISLLTKATNNELEQISLFIIEYINLNLKNKHLLLSIKAIYQHLCCKYLSSTNCLTQNNPKKITEALLNKLLIYKEVSSTYIYQINKITLIVFLFYINRFQNDIDIKIKEQFVMFCEKLVENPFIRNKTLNNLYYNLLQTIKLNSNDLRYNENYFQEFINELKIQLEENQKGNLDIVSLIKKHDSNVFKQKKLFDIYK